MGDDGGSIAGPADYFFGWVSTFYTRDRTPSGAWLEDHPGDTEAVSADDRPFDNLVHLWLIEEGVERAEYDYELCVRIVLEIISHATETNWFREETGIRIR